MIKTIQSCKTVGTDVIPVTVECEVHDSGIGLHLVGVSDEQIKETCLRTVTALASCGYRLPGRKVVVNIAPYDPAAERSEQLDLPVALALIAAAGGEDLSTEETLAIGELGLDGRLRHVDGCYAMVLDAISRLDVKAVIIPAVDAPDVRELDAAIDIYVAETLAEAVSILRSHPQTRLVQNAVEARLDTISDKDFLKRITVRDIRILALAAAGGFDVVLPDADETRARDLAQALAALLCAGVDRRRMKATYSLAGCPAPAFDTAPMQVVNPYSSPQALCGAGRHITPGFLALADGGALLMLEADRWPEGSASCVAAAHRSGSVAVKWRERTVTMPASFTLVLQKAPLEGFEEALRREGRMEQLTTPLRTVTLAQVGRYRKATPQDLQAARNDIRMARDAQDRRYAKAEAGLRRNADLPDAAAVKLGDGAHSAEWQRVAFTLADLEGAQTITRATAYETDRYFEDVNAATKQ